MRAPLERGINVNAATIDGETPLHYAAREEAMGLFSLLIDAGADAAARTKVEARDSPVALLSRRMTEARLSKQWQEERLAMPREDCGRIVHIFAGSRTSRYVRGIYQVASDSSQGPLTRRSIVTRCHMGTFDSRMGNTRFTGRRNNSPLAA